MLSMEQEAASTAIAVITLSRSDASYIEANLMLPGALCSSVRVSICLLLSMGPWFWTSCNTTHSVGALHVAGAVVSH